MKRYLLGSICAAVALVSGGTIAQPHSTGSGQGFPATPIEFVVPGNPGAGSDVFARLIVDAAKAQPKTINVSIGAAGSTSHMFVYTLERLTGARFNVVIMKSGTEAVTAVLGNHVHWSTGQLTDAMPHVAAGKMRLLGVASLQRLAPLAEVATMKEQGVDMHVAAGRSFAAPAAIPDPAAAFLENVFEKVYRSADWQDYMTRNLMEPVFMNGAEYGRYLAARQPEFTRFITDLGLAGKK